jgi:hypothetical protein
MLKTSLIVLFCLLTLSLAGCGDEATLPEQAGVGPDPKLPPPQETLFPTVNIALQKAGPPAWRQCPPRAWR